MKKSNFARKSIDKKLKKRKILKDLVDKFKTTQKLSSDRCKKIFILLESGEADLYKISKEHVNNI